LEYVASVVVVLPLTTCTFIVSYTVLPVSAVSVRSQNDSAGAAAVEGMLTDWEMFSVAVRPLPPSHAFQLPLCAGRPLSVVIGPDVPAQVTAPDSNPGLARRLLPVGGGVVPPLQVSEPAGTAMALKAAATPVHSALEAPYRSLADLIAPLRAEA